MKAVNVPYGPWNHVFKKCTMHGGFVCALCMIHGVTYLKYMPSMEAALPYIYCIKKNVLKLLLWFQFHCHV